MLGRPGAGVLQHGVEGLRRRGPGQAERVQGPFVFGRQTVQEVAQAQVAHALAQGEAVRVGVVGGDVQVPEAGAVAAGGGKGLFPGADGRQSDLQAEGAGQLRGALGMGVVDGPPRGGGGGARAGGQRDAIHERFVVGAQRLQEGEQVRERGVLQQVGGVSAGVEVDREDQGGLLPGTGGLAQAAADGLDGVDGAVARVGEDHGVDVGHVDALVQHPHVGQHRAVPVGVGEVVQQVAAPVARLLAVDRLRPQVLDAQFLTDLQGGGRKRGGEGLCEGDAVVEDQDAAQPVFGDRPQQGDLGGGVAQPVVVGTGGRAAGGEDGVQVAVVDDGHDDLVVGQDAALDGLGHAQLEHGRAEDLAVVHGGQRDAFHERQQLARGRGTPDPGRGGHVEAGLGGDRAVVVDGAPAVSEGGAGAVGLIGDHQVPGRQAVLLVGTLDVVQRAVGGEHGDRAADPHRTGDRPRVTGHHRLAGGQSALPLAQGADAEREPRPAGFAPASDGLRHQGFRRHQHQHGALGGQALRGLLGDQGLAGAAGGHHRHALFAGGHGGLDRGERLDLVLA
ncbi:hypothetical protein SAURM35S_00124 [Streptomyces aurantiogriseus]